MQELYYNILTVNTKASINTEFLWDQGTVKLAQLFIKLLQFCFLFDGKHHFLKEHRQDVIDVFLCLCLCTWTAWVYTVFLEIDVVEKTKDIVGRDILFGLTFSKY